MKKQLKTKVEIGDENYVAPGEFFLEIGEDNKVPTALKRRKDDLTMETILGSGSGDDSKTFRMNFTEAEWEDFGMNRSITLTDISEEDLTKLGNGGYKEVVISVDGRVECTLPIWYEQTRHDFENADAGVDTSPTDDTVVCVFGDSYTTVTYRTYYIINDKDGISLVSDAGFGFVPAPHLNYYVDDFHYYKDSGNPTQLGTSNWFYQYMDYDRCKGITMADCDFYPIYDSATINDAVRTIGASVFGENTQVFFFGKITKNNGEYKENSDQFVIWRDDSEMGIWKAMEISDWTVDFEPQVV